MRSNETRCYIKSGGFDGNCERLPEILDAETSGENGFIAAVYKKGDTWEIHSKICISELAEKLGISREDIQIY